MLINSVDAMKRPVSQKTLEEHYAWTRKIYQFLENPEGLILGYDAKKETPIVPSICLELSQMAIGGASSWIRNDVLKLPGRKR